VSALDGLLAGVFVAGAVLFGLGNRMTARARKASSNGVLWTQAVAPAGASTLDLAMRVDMIERLALLGEPWCVEILKQAAREERDPRIVATLASVLPAFGQAIYT
jgi:hypothetical protein